MKSTSLRKKLLLATSLLGSAGAIALPVGLLSALAPTAALAQDYTSGTLIGHVTDSSGAPVSGAAVTVRSAGTGITQNSTTDSTGTFRAPLIPTGAYSVTIRKAGFTDIAQDGLSVRIGGESNYGFTLTTPNDLDAVIVVAKKPQPQLDFSQTTKGVAIDIEQLKKQVPIGRNLTAVTLLAPGVVTAVSGFTNTDGSLVPSIGGSSAGENAFYINGLNITNFDTYIGGATVPFEFYKTIEVKTGGYPAEFGRATGGVVNAVTKTGTNDLYFAIHGDYAPNSLRETAPNTYTASNSLSRVETGATTFEAGGPLWRDHLFFYGLYQLNSSVTATAGNQTGQYIKSRNKSPFYGYKIDGYLTSRQHFEFTDFNTSQTTTSRVFGYTPPASNYRSPIIPQTIVGGVARPFDFINGGDAKGTVGQEFTGVKTKSGGNNYVAKYTGTFTDWFTLSAAYGRNHDESVTLPGVAGASYVTDATGSRVPGSSVGTAVRFGPTPSTAATTDQNFTFREFYRVDGDLYFNFLGKHHVRVGYDNEDTTLSHSSTRSGIGTITYRVVTASQAATYARSGGPQLQAGQEYVQVNFATLGRGGAGVFGNNQSEYIQDSWDITRRLNIQLGIRNDDFNVKNLQGETAINLKGNIGPRVALSYDPFGNSTDKFFASYGRYFIPPASNVSFRGADLLGSAYYLPPAGLSYSPYINGPLNTPTLGGAITPTVSSGFTTANRSGSLCPALTPTPGTRNCVINGDGTQEPAASKSALDLDTSYEDEFIIGYQKKLNNLWTVGATVTYRNLGTTSEDIAVDSAIVAYCGRNPAVAGCNAADLTDVFFGDADYVLANPGRDIKIKVRTDLATPLAGKEITLLNSDIGNPKAKREYYALELTFDRAFDGKWSLNGSYTLSKSVGNYEGTVRSDSTGGGAQVDAGSTIEFDHPGLEDGAYGLLPNHRAHQFKLYGSYQIFDGLSIGSNVQITSPRQYGCIGLYTGGVDNNGAGGYQNSSHYCTNAALGNNFALTGSSLAQRATVFQGDWFYQFDVSTRYTVPKFNKYVPGNLVLRMDVFNIFNSQQVTSYQETGDTTTGAASGTFKLPLAYQTPRSVRLGFDLVF